MLNAWEVSQSNKAHPDERSESSRARPVSQGSNFSHSETVTHAAHISTLPYMASTRLYTNNTESSTRLPTMSTSKRSASCSPAWRSQCSRPKRKSVKCLKETGGTITYSGSRSANDLPQGESYEKVMGRITDLPVMVGLKRSRGFVPAKGLPNTKSGSGAMTTPKNGCQREITRSTSCSSIYKLRHVDAKLENLKPTPHIGHKDRMRKDKKPKNDLLRTKQGIKIPGYGENDLTMHRSERVQSCLPGYVLLDLKSEQESPTTSRCVSERNIKRQIVLKKNNSTPVEVRAVATNNQISENSTTLSVMSSSEMCSPECVPPEKELDREVVAGCEQVYRNDLNEEPIRPMSEQSMFQPTSLKSPSVGDPLPRLWSGKPRMSINQKGRTQKDGKVMDNLSHISQVIHVPGQGENDLTMHRSERVQSCLPGYVLLDLKSEQESPTTSRCVSESNIKRQIVLKKNNSTPVEARAVATNNQISENSTTLSVMSSSEMCSPECVPPEKELDREVAAGCEQVYRNDLNEEPIRPMSEQSMFQPTSLKSPSVGDPLPRLWSGKPRMSINQKGRTQKDGKVMDNLSHISQVIHVPGQGENDLTMHRSERVQSCLPGYVLLDLKSEQESPTTSRCVSESNIKRQIVLKKNNSTPVEARAVATNNQISENSTTLSVMSSSEMCSPECVPPEKELDREVAAGCEQVYRNDLNEEPIRPMSEQSMFQPTSLKSPSVGDPLPRLWSGKPRMSINQKGRTQKDGKVMDNLSHISQVIHVPGQGENDLTMHRSERVQSCLPGYVLLDLKSEQESPTTSRCVSERNIKRQIVLKKNNSTPVEVRAVATNNQISENSTTLSVMSSSEMCSPECVPPEKELDREVKAGCEQVYRNDLNEEPIRPMSEQSMFQPTSLKSPSVGDPLPRLWSGKPRMSINQKGRTQKDGKVKDNLSHISQVIHVPGQGENDLTMHRSERVQSYLPGYVLLDLKSEQEPLATSICDHDGNIKRQDLFKKNNSSPVDPGDAYPYKHSRPKNKLTTGSRIMNEMKNRPVSRKPTPMPVAAGESKKHQLTGLPRTFDADVKSQCHLPASLIFVGEMNLNPEERSDQTNAGIGEVHPPDHNTEESTSIPTLPTSERSTSDDPVFYVLPDITFDGSPPITSKMKVQLKDASEKNTEITDQTSQVPSMLCSEIVSDSPVCHCLLADSSTDNPPKVLLSELATTPMQSIEDAAGKGIERMAFGNQNKQIPIHPSANESEQTPTSWYDWGDLSLLTTPEPIRLEPTSHFGDKTARLICTVVVESPQVMETGPLQLKKEDSGEAENRSDQDEKKSFHDCSPKQLHTAAKKSPIPIALCSVEGPSDTELKLSSFETKEKMNTEVLKTVTPQSHLHVRDISSNAKTTEVAQRIRPESNRTETSKINVEKKQRIEEKEEPERLADIICTTDKNGTLSPEEEKLPENAQRKLSIGAQEKLVHHNEPKSDAEGAGLKVDAETQTPCPENNPTNCLEGRIRIRAKMRVRKRNCNRQKGDGRRTHTDSTDDRRKRGLYISSPTTKGGTTRMKDTKGDDRHEEDRQSIFEEEPEQKNVTSNVLLNQAQEGPLRQKVHELFLKKASVTLWGVENVSKYARKPSERTDSVVVVSQSAVDVTEADLMDDLVGQLHCLEMVSPTAPEWDQSDVQAGSSTADSSGWETPVDFHEAFSFDIERCLVGYKPIDSPAISEARAEVSTQTLPTISALMLKTIVNQSQSEDNEPATSSDFKWEEVTQPLSMTGRVGPVSSSITVLRMSRISQFKQPCRETVGVSGCCAAVKLKSISDSEQEERNVDLPETMELFATELLPAVEWDQSDAYTKRSLVDPSGWGTPTDFQKSFRLHSEHLSDIFTTSKVGAASSTRMLPSLNTPMLNTNTSLSDTETKKLTSSVGIERKDCAQCISTTRGGIMSAKPTTLYAISPASQSTRKNEENTRVMGPHRAVELKSVLNLEHVDPGFDLPEAMEFPETELYAESEPDHSEVYAENSTAVSSQWSPQIDFHKSFDLYAESVSVKNKPIDTVKTLRMQVPPSISNPLFRTTPIQLEHEISKPVTSAIIYGKEGTEQMLINRRKRSTERSFVLLSASPILQSTRGNKDISGLHLAVESKSMLHLEHVESGVDPPEAVRLLETEVLSGSERDESYTYNENSWSSDGLDIEEESPAVSLSGSDDIACFSSVKHAEMASPSQPNVKSSRFSSQVGDSHKKAPNFTSISTTLRDFVTFAPCLPHSLRSSTRVEQQVEMTNMCTVNSVHWNCTGARAQSSISLSTASSTFSPPWHRKSTFFVSPETNSSHFPSSTSCSCPRSIVRATKLRAYPTAFLTLVAPCPVYYQIPLVVAVPRFLIYSSTSPQALAADARSATEIVSACHKNISEQYDDTSCCPAVYLSVSPSDTRLKSSSSLPSLLDENPVPSSKTSPVPQQVGLEKNSSTYRPHSLYAETSPGLNYGLPLFLSSAVGKSSVSKRKSMDDLHARLSKTPTQYSSRDLVALSTPTPMHSVQVRADQHANNFLIRHPTRVSQNTPVQTNEERENSVTFTFLDSVPPSYSAPYYYAYESYSSTTDDIPSMKTYFAPTGGVKEECISPATFEHVVEESISTFVCPWSRDMPHSICALLTYTQGVHDLVTILHPQLDSALLERQLCESESIRKISATESFSNSPERLTSDLQKSVKDIIVVSSYMSEQPVQISGSVEYNWPLKETAFSLREYQHLGSTRPSVFSSFRLPLLPLSTISLTSCTPDNFRDQNSWTFEPLATQLEGTPIRLSRSSLAIGPPSNSPHAMESKYTGVSWDSRSQSSSSLKGLRKAQLSKNVGHDLPYRTLSSGSLSTKPSVSDYSEHHEGSYEKLVHPFEKKDFPLSGDRKSSCSVRRRTTHDLDVRKDLQRCQCFRLQCKHCTRKPNYCECVLKRSCHCPSRGVHRRRSYLGCLTQSCPHTRSRCILGAFTPNFGCLSLERTRLISLSKYTRNTGFICSAPCLDQEFGLHTMRTQETEPVYVRCQTVNKIVCTHGCGRTNIPRHHMCYFGK
ncbi:hypothetical protein CRM22_010645 [Opisthorchis felineus]|uniref:Uncharacterized protein n=1 Tax=Opisthorchis felineus TaxID=147828 RepID=A0A4S2KR64_OPIFE|nr:hypothetical protein CRM22_010645 [Opisthorchis felineus]